MVATTPQAQVSTPSVSLETLRAVLADQTKANPDQASRLFRAATIVALRNIEQTPGGYLVESERDPGSYYLVTQDGMGVRCICVDYRNRGGLACKHILAVNLLKNLATLPPDNVTPMPARTLADDEPIPFVLTNKALAALETPTYPVA
ncbi:MAG TPA: hypothetical protein VII06_33235 [Chloroflexota bacterium]|jgi:hypothetical protein